MPLKPDQYSTCVPLELPLPDFTRGCGTREARVYPSGLFLG